MRDAAGTETSPSRISPTAPLPASLDFPLRAQEEPSAFDVVLLTDPQPAGTRPGSHFCSGMVPLAGIEPALLAELDFE
ncbi:MAG: hypothetical protein QM651_18350, partial [Rhodoblastus sp.]